MSNEFPFDVKILYEDADCVVIDKPAGLMVHDDGKNKGPFLTDWIIQKFPDAVNVGEVMNAPDGSVLLRPGIVHRLDRETSGALIIAKTAHGHAWLKKQFQERTIDKKYLAFVWGEFREEFGTITRPIGRSNKDFTRWSAQRGMRGELREAETYWTRLWTGLGQVKQEAESREYEAGNMKQEEKNAQQTGTKLEKFSLIEAEPKTGRTHQIRVHFLAVHHPVVGDSLYAPKKPLALGFGRMALFARSIEFTNTAGKKVMIKAPLPEDFARACQTLKISTVKM